MAKKSVDDIYRQYRRILEENIRRNPSLSSGVERERVNKALDAYKRYAVNMGRNKSMQKDWDSNRKFSRSNYMGMANNAG